MKRTVFCFICLLVMSLACQAQHVIGTRIFWSVAYTDPTDLSNEHPRGPVAPPVVYQEDNTLTFVADHPENPNTYVNLGATLEVKIEKNESSNTLIMYLCIGIITKDYLI